MTIVWIQLGLDSSATLRPEGTRFNSHVRDDVDRRFPVNSERRRRGTREEGSQRASERYRGILFHALAHMAIEYRPFGPKTVVSQTVVTTRLIDKPKNVGHHSPGGR